MTSSEKPINVRIRPIEALERMTIRDRLDNLTPIGQPLFDPWSHVTIPERVLMPETTCASCKDVVESNEGLLTYKCPECNKEYKVKEERLDDKGELI